MDTVEANYKLGFKGDERDYSQAADMLKDLEVISIRIMTNNPKKVRGLQEQGIIITQRKPIIIPPTDQNKKYIQIKKEKMGHIFE